jgi:hypothetical protein
MIIPPVQRTGVRLDHVAILLMRRPMGSYPSEAEQLTFADRAEVE